MSELHEPPSPPAGKQRRMTELIERVERSGARGLSAEEVLELPRLYRQASDALARAESGGGDPRVAARLRPLVTRAHAVLYAPARGRARSTATRALRFLLRDSARAVRAEWKLGLAVLVFFYGLAALAYYAVSRDLELAFVLMDEESVAGQIAQLRATEEGEPFRGNFTFGLDNSANVSGWILAHNITVAVIFFGAGLLPPLFLMILASNALMLGTYTAVAAHWDQAGAISSILWCHGTIELQMIVLAGMAGVVLVRAWIAPGPWSRAHAMVLESRRAWALLAPAIAFLFVSGFIEGYVSPHAPFAVRVGVAFLSLVLLVLWIAVGGRPEPEPPPARAS